MLTTHLSSWRELLLSIPLQCLAQPDEIAKLVVFLCSQDNTYLTGQSIIIDGGFTHK
ncbi:SDR family oxidoreductase [Microcystis aeruginosa]|uniref:SDR family oxidoreductase n=1 Tax=Microcystis aeruginosa TaxID=1126 RepID=UPI00352EE0EB